MTSITLTKTETRLLTEAAGREHGLLVLPGTMKAASVERLVARLLKRGVITAREQDGTTDHNLTPPGYQAIGLKPPRPRAKTDLSDPAQASQPGTKRAQILDLLGRGKGASLPELMVATGWLPHTTRAALSRLRSGGATLVKSTREDGRTAYRIATDEPKPRKRAPRQPSDDQAEAETA